MNFTDTADKKQEDSKEPVELKAGTVNKANGPDETKQESAVKTSTDGNNG